MSIETRHQPALHGNLPRWDIGPWVGRDETLATACELLRVRRLVTLTGAGGVGKTRLALRVAATVGPAVGDGAWIVALDKLNELGGSLSSRVALALGIRQHRHADLDVLIAHLRTRRVVLVLDGCEASHRDVRRLVAALLEATSSVRVVVTSRQRLGIYGENVVHVPALPIDDAVSLFIQLAAASCAGTRPALNEHEVHAVCSRLDGLPLAIRLAASRARHMSLAELATHLDRPFSVLSDPSAADSDPHAALVRVVELSYRMCTPAEQQVWARASVFVGSFDSCAAEAVAGGPDCNPAGVLDALAGLVDKSVLTVDTSPDCARYSMLDSLRSYGRDRLAEAQQTAAAQARHGTFYQGLLARVVATWLGPQELTVLADVRDDLSNILTAIDHSLARRDLVTARALARDLVRSRAPFFYGFLGLSYDYLQRVIAACDPQPADPREAADLAATVAAAAWIVATQGRRDTAHALLARADSLLVEHQIPTIAPVLFARGGGDTLLTGDPGALAVLSAARAELNTPDTAGDRHMATMMYVIALALRTREGADDADQRAAAEQAARAYVQEAEHAGAAWALSWALWACALAALRGDRLDQATTDVGRCLRLQRDMDDQWGKTWSLELCVWIITARLPETTDPTAEAHRAAWLLGAARALQQNLGVDLTGLHPLAEGHRHARALLVEVLGERTVSEDERAGQARSTDAVRIAVGEQPSRRPSATSPDDLTDREHEVAALIAQGLTNKQIANHLLIKTRTVDSHVSNIMTKLGVHTRTAIASQVSAREAVHLVQ